MNQEITQSESPRVAVIILNWNGEKLLSEFLPSVIRHTPKNVGHVIVADNGSTDNSVGLLKTKFPDVELLRFKENYGFAAGYNKSIEYYADRFPYIVLLNSDVAVKDDWLTPLYDFMELHPEVGACQPKIRSYREPDMFEYAGASGGFIDRNGYPYCRGRVFSTIEKDLGQYDDILPVFWATGAALMVRTDCYISAGGLDEAFFAHMEEIDLCWRIHLMGKEIYAVPQSVVYHLGGGSLDAKNPRKTYLNFRNNLLMLHKNLPDSSRSSSLFRRRLLDTVAWLKSVMTLDWNNAAAIWRAHRDFSKMRNTYNVHPSVDLLHTDPHRPNILTQYYIHRHETFNKIKA